MEAGDVARLCAGAAALAIAGALLVVKPVVAALAFVACIVAIGVAISRGPEAMRARARYGTPPTSIGPFSLRRWRRDAVRPIERTIRYALATGVVAILLVALIPHAQHAYRLWAGRAAYAAMIVAMIALALEWFVQPPSGKSAHRP